LPGRAARPGAGAALVSGCAPNPCGAWFCGPSSMHSASPQKDIHSKSVINVSIIGIMLTPWGCLDTSRGRQRRTPQPRKGSQIAPKGVADLLLEGRGHLRWPCGPGTGRNPRKARFSAQPKMRPHYALQGEALLNLKLCRKTGVLKQAQVCRAKGTV
jgi:hypothetical protein